MNAKPKLSLHLFALTAIVLWALGFVLTRVAVQYFTPESTAFLRYLIAATTLIIYALIKRMPLPKLKDIPLFFLGGTIGFALYVYALNTGSQTISASVASFVIASSPVITAALAQVFLKERIGLVGWLSVACAFVGVGVITLSGSDVTLGTGILWIFLSALLISLYNIFQRVLLKRYSPLQITTYCIISGAILLSVFSPNAFVQLSAAPADQIITVSVLGVGCAAIAYLCWAYALSKAEKTSEVTNYMFLTPLLTTLLGVVMIGEAPSLTVYLGGALVLLGVLLVNMRQRLGKRAK